MSTQAPKKTEDGPAIRKVTGPICATCASPTGLIELNGKTVQVESRMVVAGDSLIFAVHCCRQTPATKPEKPRRNGRWPKR